MYRPSSSSSSASGRGGWFGQVLEAAVHFAPLLPQALEGLLLFLFALAYPVEKLFHFVHEWVLLSRYNC